MSQLSNIVWDQDTWDEIIDDVVGGMPITHALKGRGIKWRTWETWLLDDPTRADAYWRAKGAHAEHVADTVLGIATAPCREKLDGSWDGVDIQQRKLVIDSIKWVACKLAPAKYGDKPVKLEDFMAPGASVVIQLPNNGRDSKD